MTLPVPLTVRVGEDLVTQEVQSVSFRREAVGGCRSIAFSLARPLSDLGDLDPLAKVYVFDGRTASTVVEGRLTDTGRGANADGERWDCVAFGPVQHASDISQSSVFVDRSIGEGWRLADVIHPDASIGAGSKPGDAASAASQGVLASFQDGIPVNTDSRATLRYETLWLNTGQTLGGFQFTWVTSGTSSQWLLEGVTRLDGSGTGENTVTTTWSTGGGSANMVVVTNFPAGRNTLDLRVRWIGGAATTAGETWGWFDNIVIRPQLKLKDGTNREPFYHALDYIVAHDVIEDVLGRLLPEYDGPNATVDQTGLYEISNLAYREPVTPAQIFEDLMRMNPSHRWYTTPSTTDAGLYPFRWEVWPTTVRYEATLDDGGSFPISTQSVYNQVSVHWVDATGGVRSTLRTMECPVLDDRGIIRRASLGLGTEAGSEVNAIQAGDAFLADHNVPKNSGTLTVARPIRDLSLGTLVQPWEIEAGELIRIRGVEAYPDAFNADTNDGQGVFRIHAVDYTTEGNVATLALDSDARETEDALVKLMNQRARR